MQTRKIILLSGLISFGMSYSYLSVADDDKNYIYKHSTKGVQITIETGQHSPDFPIQDLNGMIRINMNDSEGEEFISGPISMPSINPGNLVSFDPYPDAMQTSVWELVNNPEPSPLDQFTGNLIGPPLPYGAPQIRPPLPMPFEQAHGMVLITVDIPGIGLVGQSLLSPESVKKISKFHYAVSFDVCDTDLIAETCGLVEFTVKKNGFHTSSLKGLESINLWLAKIKISEMNLNSKASLWKNR